MSGGADIQRAEGGSDRKFSFDRTNPISFAGSGRLDPVPASSSSTKMVVAVACVYESPVSSNRKRSNREAAQAAQWHGFLVSRAWWMFGWSIKPPTKPKPGTWHASST
jgi:hypothetical protein